MCSLEQFKIDLKNQKDEVRTLDFDLDNLFFAALDGSEVKQGALHVSVSIRKTIGFYELLFHTEGTVTVTCDRCLDDMSLHHRNHPREDSAQLPARDSVFRAG